MSKGQNRLLVTVLSKQNIVMWLAVTSGDIIPATDAHVEKNSSCSHPSQFGVITVPINTVWLGLSNKTTWLGLGKDHGLSKDKYVSNVTRPESYPPFLWQDIQLTTIRTQNRFSNASLCVLNDLYYCTWLIFIILTPLLFRKSDHGCLQNKSLIFSIHI